MNSIYYIPQSHEDLLRSLVENIPKGSSLSHENLDVQEVRLNYGMGSENPIEHVRFYSKKAPNVAKVLRKEEVSAMLPQRYTPTRITFFAQKKLVILSFTTLKVYRIV